jgi:hypothetical protein
MPPRPHQSTAELGALGRFSGWKSVFLVWLVCLVDWNLLDRLSMECVISLG